MRRRLLLPAVACLLVPLNSTMVAVALPTLRDELGVSIGAATSVVTAYLVAMLIALPVGGRIAQRGRADVVLRAAVVAFLSFSVAAALAPSIAWLAAARAAQAIAAAFGMTSAIALVRSTNDGSRLGFELGLVGAAIPIGAMLGPLLAGVVLKVASWRILLLANLAFAPALAARVPRAPAPPPREPREPRAGAAWRDALPSGPLARACAAMAALNLAMYTLIVALPIALQDLQEWSPLAVGAALAAVPLTATVAAVVGGQAVDRHSTRAVAAVGAVLVVAGCLTLATGGGSLRIVALVPAAVAVGVGIGVAGVALQAVGVTAVAEPETAGAVGTIGSARYLGGICGALVVGLSIGDPPTTVGVLGAVLLAAAAAAVALVLCLRLPRQTVAELAVPKRPVIGRD